MHYIILRCKKCIQIIHLLNLVGCFYSNWILKSSLNKNAGAESWHLSNPQRIILESNNSQYSYRKKKGILINKMCIFCVLFLKQKKQGRREEISKELLTWFLGFWEPRAPERLLQKKWGGNFSAPVWNSICMK